MMWFKSSITSHVVFPLSKILFNWFNSICSIGWGWGCSAIVLLSRLGCFLPLFWNYSFPSFNYQFRCHFFWKAFLSAWAWTKYSSIYSNSSTAHIMMSVCFVAVYSLRSIRFELLENKFYRFMLILFMVVLLETSKIPGIHLIDSQWLCLENEWMDKVSGEA